MLKAAGALILAKNTGRVLMNLRGETSSYPYTFGFFGGKAEKTEKITENLRRELQEELGNLPKPIKSLPIDVFRSPDGNFEYYSFVILIEEEFIPQLNEESAGYAWIEPGRWPKPLHPGAANVLKRQGIIKNLKEFVD